MTEPPPQPAPEPAPPSRDIAVGDPRIAELVAAIRGRTPARLLLGRRGGSYQTADQIALRAAESLSAYMAHRPAPHHTDAHRNLVSNIHAAGTPPERAAERIAAIAAEMIRRGTSGTAIKESIRGDDTLFSKPSPPSRGLPPSHSAALPTPEQPENFP